MIDASPAAPFRTDAVTPAERGRATEHEDGGVGFGELDRRGRREGVLVAHRREAFGERGAERLLTARLDEELQPSLGDLVDVALGDEPLDDRPHRRPEVGTGHERSQHEREAGSGAEAAARPDLVAGLAVAHARHQADVVGECLEAARGAAAERDVQAVRQGDVELASSRATSCCDSHVASTDTSNGSSFDVAASGHASTFRMV